MNLLWICGIRFSSIDSKEMDLPGYLHIENDGVVLSVKLQPRASQNAIGTALENELRIKVTAPPVDSAANEALIELLAERLDCPRNRFKLIRGHTSRHKQLKIYGTTVAEVLSKLAPG